ncbi:MAG: GNAT family N-acetyltransferase [Hyphomicrobiaceae bacterium]
MPEETELHVQVIGGIDEVDAASWNNCANPNTKLYNPFISHAFLKSLEDAETVHPRTGWQPQHLLLKCATGTIQGCMPLYAKSHSKGEYVFDYGWADAFERAGGQYYPKLVSAVPFSPVPGPRLLVLPGSHRQDCEDLLLSGAVELVKRYNLSSLHINFLPQDQCQRICELGFLKRYDQQFHFMNANYGSFEDFLLSLASRKRKAVRRERARALSEGITIEWVRGRDISEAHWDALYSFYMETGSRKWGRPYLNRTFFSLLGSEMPDDCILIMAKRNGKFIAGALNLIGGDCLYGRYWGAIEHHPYLHFEICYYQAIDFAITHKLLRVEAGAQGEHKLARGYLPTLTYSAHYIPNPDFRQAIDNYLKDERSYVENSGNILADYAPFRRSNDDRDQI